MSNAIARPFQVLREYSVFLIVGSVAALIWANLDLASYLSFINTSHGNFQLFGRDIAHHGISIHFLVNELFMVFFFGVAAKEVVEAFLPGGPLSSLRKASLPMMSTIGGVVGPAGSFAILCMIFAEYLMPGWAVPTATDIAYSWLFATLIFGSKHPATKFLLTLAVLDDLIGMVIIAIFYSSSIQLEWLGFVALAVAICAAFRWIVKVDSYWPYILVGFPLCWIGLHFTGVHSALALVPIVPFLPSHQRQDYGMFAEEDLPMEEGMEDSSGEDEEHAASPHHHPTDALSMFEHNFKPYVDVGLFFFGFANAGVPLSAVGIETWITVFAIFIGKTIGIYIFTVLGRLMRLTLPAGMTMNEAFVMGNVAAIGFTVALFVTDVAFPSGGHGAHGDHGDDHHGGVPALGPGEVQFASGATDQGLVLYAAADDAAHDHAHDHDHGDHAHDDHAHGAASDGPPPAPDKTQKFDDLTKAQQAVVKDKVKMGALLSFFAGLTSMILGRLLGVRKIETEADLRRAIRETGVS